MSEQPQPQPTPTTDDGVDRAPGGADASPNESDVGAVTGSGERLTPDPPLSAQQEDEKVPDEIRTPEPSDEAGNEETQQSEPAD